MTGILFYFGYVSSKSFYAYFGVTLSALDLSTSTYAVRAPETLFRPVVALILILLAVAVAHHSLHAYLARVRPRESLVALVVLMALGVVGLVVGLDGLRGGTRGAYSALALAVGALLVELGLWTGHTSGLLPAPVSEVYRDSLNVRRGLLAALLVVAAFWATTILAIERGADTARLVERSLPLQPQAVVYSKFDMQLPGSMRTELAPGGAYRYRYNGLRPLLYSDGRWFLVPARWTRQNGLAVIVLADAPAQVRVDLAP